MTIQVRPISEKEAMARDVAYQRYWTGGNSLESDEVFEAGWDAALEYVREHGLLDGQRVQDNQTVTD